MRIKNKKVAQKISKVNRKELNSNTQKVFMRLVKADNDGWVARTSFGIPSVTSRIRDLRKNQYGSFTVECASAEDINKSGRSRVTDYQTYYRIVPSSVTENGLNRILKGVI